MRSLQCDGLSLYTGAPLGKRPPTSFSLSLTLTLLTEPSLMDSPFVRRIHIDKIKKEPTRCLKCQGWNHFANECDSETDKCGNCAEEHRTSNCPHPHRRACVSCKTAGHGSWSRECPVFLRKAEECNRRNPGNALQFIPTSEP